MALLMNEKLRSRALVHTASEHVNQATGGRVVVCPDDPVNARLKKGVIQNEDEFEQESV